MSFQVVEQFGLPCAKCGRDLFFYQPDPAGGALIQVPEPGLTLKNVNKAERVAFAECPACKNLTMIDMGYFGLE